jgi:hypothetical protein
MSLQLHGLPLLLLLLVLVLLLLLLPAFTPLACCCFCCWCCCETKHVSQKRMIRSNSHMTSGSQLLVSASKKVSNVGATSPLPVMLAVYVKFVTTRVLVPS